MPDNEIPKLGGAHENKKGAAAAVAWLKQHKGAVGAGIGAFLAIGFIGILLLPPVEEPAINTGENPLFGQMDKWKAPNVSRGDPRDLIKQADSLAGVDGGRPISYDDDDVQGKKGGKGGAETVAAAAGPAGGAGENAAAGRLTATKNFATLNDEKVFGGRRGGGSSATQTIAQAGPSAGRPGAEARGPVARAQRRLRAMVRRISRGASGLFAGVKHAFGLGPKGYAAGAAGSATFATASGGAEGSAAVAGGTIGDLGSGRDDKSGGHNVPSTKLVPPPPVPSPKAVNPAQKPKDLQCAAVKAAEADFWSAFDKIQNVNKRYHTTGEQDKDLLVPLMELTAKKFGEFDKKVGEILTELNTLNLSCQECEPLEECRQLAQRTIGTGMGGLDSAARNIQDMVRAGQKGMGLCGPHGYENPGAASECYELGLEMIAMDQKTKTAIDTHIAAVVANKGVGGRECTAPALKADGKPNVGAADANARWEAWAKKDVEQFFKPMQEYLSTGWCSDPRAIEKCTPVRWGQLGVAQTALANLQKSARDFEGFLGSGSGYSSRLAEAAGHVRTAIRYHKNTSADWGKAVFEGVNAEDKAAQVMNGLDLEYAKLAKHCQMPGY